MIHSSMADQNSQQFMRDRRFWGATVAIVLVATALRFYHLGYQELWLDETLSYYIVSAPNWEEFVIRESSPPLFYLLLRPWTLLAGTTEVGLRSLSAFCGVLAVGSLILTGRILFNPAVGLWTGAFAALAPIHIYYSQETRTYSLLLLWLILAYAALARALRNGTWPAWLGVSVFALLALYSHYFSILALIPTALLVYLWPVPDVRGKWIRYSTVVVLCMVLFSPWMLLNLSTIAHPTAQHSWIQEFWEKTPPPVAIPKSLEAMAFGTHIGVGGSYMKQFTMMTFPSSMRGLGLGVLSAIVLIVLLPWGDGQLNIPWLLKRKIWLLTFLLFPLLVIWTVSLLYKPYYLVGRYDIIAFPAFALFVALGLAKLQVGPRMGVILALLAASLLLIPIATKLFLYYQAPPDSMLVGAPARTTASVLDQLVENGDAVAFGSLRGMPVLYYLEQRGYHWSDSRCENARTGRHFICRIYPSQIHELLFDFDHPKRVVFSEEVVRRELRDVVMQLESSINLIWVVLDLPDRQHLLQPLRNLGLVHAYSSDLYILAFATPGVRQ